MDVHTPYRPVWLYAPVHCQASAKHTALTAVCTPAHLFITPRATRHHHLAAAAHQLFANFSRNMQAVVGLPIQVDLAPFEDLLNKFNFV